MKNGTTICSKHDSLMELAQDIIHYAAAAKEDGQSMEAALDRYKIIISELEKRVEELEEELATKNTELIDIMSECAELQYRLASLEE